MEVALITDLHYGVRSDNRNFLDYYKSFNEVFIKYLENNKIKEIVMLGDLFDHRKFINFYTLYRFREDFFQPLMEYVIENNATMHLIVGNHDIYYKNTLKVNALNELIGDVTNFNVVDSPFTTYVGGEETILVPWISDENKDLVMKSLDKTNAKICMGHFEIEGFGDNPKVGLSPEVFRKFDLVLSGHYHTPSSKGNIRYIGAAHEQTWADYGSDRGFSVLNTKTRDITFIKNEISIFKTMVYDDVENQDEIRQKLRFGDFSEFSNKYLKVIIINRQDPILFEEYIKAIDNCGPIDYTVIESELVSSSEEDDSDSEKKVDVKDTKRILEDYVDNVETKLDKSRLKSKLMQIYATSVELRKDV